MTTIISTQSVQEKTEEKLKNVLGVDFWITPNSIPYKKETICSLLKKKGVTSGNIIVFVKYGRRNPSDFPEICLENYVISLVFYKDFSDITNWIKAVDDFSEKKPEKVLALAMMKPFYMKWGEKIYQCLRKERYAKNIVSKHFGDTTTNLELGKKLSKGCNLAVYVGHGRSRGWSGYRGFRWKHLAINKQLAPIGSLISLSCSSLMHDKEMSLPMGLQLIMEGRSCSFLGTWDAVQIVPLRTITTILLDLFSEDRQQPLGELLYQAHQRIIAIEDPAVTENWFNFRLIGNPFQLV